MNTLIFFLKASNLSSYIAEIFLSYTFITVQVISVLGLETFLILEKLKSNKRKNEIE